MFFRTYHYFLGAIIALAFIVFFFTMHSTTPPIVAITQIAQHPSLDKIRSGIVDKLKQVGIQDNQILYQNAQGNPATALQIAQKFVSLKPQVIVPITTPSAQAAYTVAKPANIPVIFSAVSDPLTAKLIDPTSPDALIAGVSDLSPIKEQVRLMKEIMPSLQTVGIVYNSGEENAVVLTDLFEKEAALFGIKIIRATATGTNNVGAAVTTLMGKVQALYIPNDNTVIAAFENVLKITQKHKIPIFTADPESVSRGALASVAYNQYEIGKKTAELVINYLQRKKTLSQMGIQKPDRIDLVLNRNTARTLGIVIPETLLKRATYLIEE